ncbi:MAG: hypothetical protein IJT23_03305 [Clostridia bacterium]|nr:hypothetical protein [Clostridia bacterium]
MSKKFTSSIVIFAMLCTFFSTAVYSQKADADTWQSYTSGSASVNKVDGGMVLDVNTKAGESGVARAKYKLSGNASVMYFSMTFSTGATDASGFYPDRTVYIAPDTDDLSAVKKASVLMCISGNDLLGGANYEETGASVLTGDKHTLCATVNRQDNSVEIWLDGSNIGKSAVGQIEVSQTQDLCLIFENTYPVNKKNARASQFALYDVCDSVSAVPDISAKTDDYTNYAIDIGTIAYGAKISISDAGDYTYEFTGGGFNVSFSKALDENKEYAVTLSDIQTLDGKKYTGSCTLNKREYEFSLPDRERYNSDELAEFAVTTQDSVDKVSYYVDGEYFADTNAPFNIDLSGLSNGAHTVAAVAKTQNGKLLTDKKEITVVNKTIDPKVKYDFEDLPDGNVSVNASNRIIGANDLYSNVVGDDKFMRCGEVEGHKKAFIYGSQNTLNASSPFVAACMSASNVTVLFNTDILFFDTEATTNLIVRGADSSGATVFLGNIVFAPVAGKMEIQAYNGSIISTVAKLDINKWYTIGYEFDLVNQKYSFYLDGEKIVDSYKFNAELTMLNNMVRFNTAYKAGTTSQMALDNIALSIVNESMGLEPVSVEKGEQTVTIPQTGTQSELTKTPVVKKDGRTIDVLSWRQTGGNLVIEFKDKLMQTGRYDISIETKREDKPVSGYFTVISNEADIRDISIFGSEGKCSVVFTQNEKAGGEELIFIVNRYSDKKLVHTYVQKGFGYNVSIEDIEYKDGDVIKAFVLQKKSETLPFSDTTAQSVMHIK